MEEIAAEVMTRLVAIEQEHDVSVVYCCESGSRAWGFASTDSDYDVRFLYVRRRDWYLSVDLEERRDVIETPIDGLWDVNGWDLRKALRLLRKSNPPLFEWLQSPIVYREHTSTTAMIRRMLPEYFSPPACMYHYLHMAQGNFREFLRGDVVWVKKYFYVLRPLLACRWIERGLGVVPIEFQSLVGKTVDEPDVNDAIAALLEKKRAGVELDRGPRVPALSSFIEREITRHEDDGVRRRKPDTRTEPLSDLFRKALTEVWGGGA